MMLRCLIMLLSLFAWDKVTHILKNIATFVTDSIDDDGIYNACVNLGLFK